MRTGVRSWLAGVVALGLLAPAAAAQPAQLVVVDAARTEPLTQMRSVTGDVRSLRRSLVAAQVEGFVVELPLNEGDAVEAGQVIARLDAETAQLDVDEARAAMEEAEGSVREAEANLARAQRDLERVQEALRRGSLSESELDEAETDVLTRRALLAQAAARAGVAKADLGRRERALRDKVITAPFTGRVVAKSSEVGEWVTPGDPVVDLVSLDELEARIDVPESFVRFLEPGGAATVEVSVPALGPGVRVTARVVGVVPVADELSRLFPVRLGIEGDGGRLKPGMSLTAFVPTGSVEPTLTVDKDAVLRDDAGEYVYMAVPHTSETDPRVNGRAVPARIARLYAVGQRVAIRPGQVQEGTLVLVQGNERVFPMQPLVVSNPPPGSPLDAGAGGPGQGDGGRGDGGAAAGGE